MSKLIMIDGLPHRMRRGKLVAIPLEWFGRITSDETIRQRKAAAKARKTRGARQRKRLNAKIR